MTINVYKIFQIHFKGQGFKTSFLHVKLYGVTTGQLYVIKPIFNFCFPHAMHVQILYI